LKTTRMMKRRRKTKRKVHTERRMWRIEWEEDEILWGIESVVSLKAAWKQSSKSTNNKVTATVHWYLKLYGLRSRDNDIATENRWHLFQREEFCLLHLILRYLFSKSASNRFLPPVLVFGSWK
jgi:hypothetical protein